MLLAAPARQARCERQGGQRVGAKRVDHRPQQRIAVESPTAGDEQIAVSDISRSARRDRGTDETGGGRECQR